MSMMDAYCVDEITILRWNGQTSWGEPVSGTEITVKGYVDWKTRLVRNSTGEQVTSAVMVYLPKKVERAGYLGRKLSHEDRIWLPDESFDRAIIEIRRPKDFSHEHLEVYLA
jgi:hypothetical protein